MPVKTYYSGNCTDDDLTWYWEQGLHDAEITGIEEVELAYDYTERNPLRTCLVIHLNTEHAYSPIKLSFIIIKQSAEIFALDDTGCVIE